VRMDNIDLIDARVPEFQVIIIIDQEDGRLFPLAVNTPRCLLPIANRKLLSYQLDMIVQSGVTDVIIVSPQEFIIPLRQFKNEDVRDNINIDLVFVDNVEGAVDCIRAVNDRIRGDFICITSDVISQVNLFQLVTLHRIRTSDITMLLTNAPIEENEKKRKELKIDDEDQEYIGLSEDSRVLVKASVIDIEKSLSISKPLLNRCANLTIRNDLLDVGIYVMSKWVMEFIKSNKSFSSLRMDLIPYLVNRQYQTKEFLYKEIPALINRKRHLDVLDSWLISKQSSFSDGSLDLVQHLSDCIISNKEESNCNINNNDLLRLYALVYDIQPTDGQNSPFILAKVINNQSYMTINREVPLHQHSSITPWPRINFLKKEQSVVGNNCEIGDKVTYKYCSIGSNVKISAKSKLNNCVIMNHVVIGENCTIQNSIICSNAIIENNCNLNECQVGAGVRVNTGSKIKSDSIVDDR